MGDNEEATAATIVVMQGDQTGQELLVEALRVIDPAVTGVPINFQYFDLSLPARRATKNGVVYEAAAALRAAGLGLKAATITPEAKDDVGSPNAILRKEVDGKVIMRTGRRIARRAALGGVYSPITVVRMAVDDAYGAKEWREGEGEDEWAFRTEKISRRTCRAVAEYAFQRARAGQAKVFGGPKYTVSPGLRGDAEGGDGRGRQALPRRTLRAAVDRRDLRPAAFQRRRSDGDPGAQPRRRPAQRPGAEDVRFDRRGGVTAAGVRR